MLQIFLNSSLKEFSSLKVYPKLRLVRSNLLLNINKIRTFFTNQVYRPEKVSNIENMLVTRTPSFSLSDEDYFRIINNSADDFTRMFGITSISNVGVAQSENLFTNGDELYVLAESNYKLRTIETDEQIVNELINIEPLKVIYHNVKNDPRDYNLEIRQKYLDLKGSYVVVEIDLLELFMGFKYWAKLRLRNGLDTPPYLYLTQVVLPNMLYSMVELTTINRIKDYVEQGIEHTSFKNVYPFYILDISQTMNNTVKEYVDFIRNKRLDIFFYISTMPLLNIRPRRYSGMVEFLKLREPNMFIQTKWIKWASRIDYVVMLLKLLGTEGLKMNTKYYGKIRFDIKEIENNVVRFPKGLSADNIVSIRDKINYLKETALGANFDNNK